MNLRPTHPNVANVSRSTNIDFCLSSKRLFFHIRFATSTPFDLDVLGDHRGVILDINLTNIFEEDQAGVSITGRKLILCNPKSMEKYLNEVEEKFEKQNIYKRKQMLLQRVNQGQTYVRRIMDSYEK